MEENNTTVSRRAGAFAKALALAAIVNGLLVVAKEKIPKVMSGMKHITGHHWVTHTAVVVSLFLVVGGILSSRRGPDPGVRGVIRLLVAGTGVGAALIVGFYLFAD